MNSPTLSERVHGEMEKSDRILLLKVFFLPMRLPVYYRFSFSFLQITLRFFMIKRVRFFMIVT
jgi:hypothetical protein